MSYFYFQFKPTSTLTSNREYIISSNNPINSFYLYWKETMFIKLNKNTIYVNFNKHKKRIYSYTHYTHGLLKTKQKPICI